MEDDEMTLKEQVRQAIETLTETELEDVSRYLICLKLRTRHASQRPQLSDADLARLYGEAAEDDRRIEEEGIFDRSG